MSIQYAGGTNVSASVAADDRPTLAANLITQLTNAGWTVDVNTSATDKTMKTATTAQSLNIRVRVYDPGSGNCVRLKMSNAAGTKTQTGDVFLLPGAGKTYRVIANRYQFFCFTAGSSATREVAAGGTPYLPSFLNGVVTECGWLHGNASSDTDTTARNGLRTHLGFGARSTTNSVQGNGYYLCNGNALELNATTTADLNSSNPGCPELLAMGTQALALSGKTYRWHDDSLHVYEALPSWGLTAVTDEARVRGQLWDAMIVSDSFTGDTTLASFDSRNWWAVTNSNAGNGSNYARGTLFVVVP